VDFDGDEQLDLVSGSYDPGELYLFRGHGRGQFSAREVITDKSGKPILKVPNQQQPVQSFGSWMTLVDWDDDGDLDILVGTFEGLMFLRRNEGTRKQPAYATTNEWVEVESKPLRVPSGQHANPVIGDWDGDGRWDLISGAGDGGVYWYRNTGQRGEPQFEPPLALVPKHEGTGYSELLDADQEPKPGIRSQIAVTDYDRDGKLDLLLGDFCTYLHIRQDLNSQQRSALEAARSQQDKAAKNLRESVDALRERYAKLLEGVPRAEWRTAENSAKWQTMYREMQASAEYKAQMAEYNDARQHLQQFVDRQTGRSSGPDVAHGYVWLFRRK
jgi:hypothetical protein